MRFFEREVEERKKKKRKKRLWKQIFYVIQIFLRRKVGPGPILSHSLII